MRMKEKVYAQEKVHFNLVRFQKFGKNFEIVVDPDLAIAFKNKNSDSTEELAELVKSEKIFSEAKKGTLASEEDIEKTFLTTDFYKAAMKILKQGEIQISAEYREQLREEKKKQIINTINRIAIDPRTGLPHPVTRITIALEEAKVKIDEYKKAEEQIQEIIHKLKPILPIRIEEKTIQIKLPMQYAAKLQGYINTQGKIETQDWLSDGSFVCKLKIPAGALGDIIDELNTKTRGVAEIEEIKK